MSSNTHWLKDKTIAGAIIVSALGYFVDVYDLTLFAIVRTASLASIGSNSMEHGMLLLDLQMLGMLIGGVLWGILGDKKGRVKVLFGSIFTYSVANVLNGFVTDIYQYGALRLIAGIGLAGEIGAGITLVSELMPKESRGIATTLVATVGVCGALVASLVGHYFDWRVTYIVGGSLGFLLLILRIKVTDSSIYELSKQKEGFTASLKLFFAKKRALKILACTLVGMPIWMVAGVLVTFSPEIGQYIIAPEYLGDSNGGLIAGTAVFVSYLGFIAGDLGAGLLSQFFNSRKRVMSIAIILTGIFSTLYLQGQYFPFYAYLLLGLIGFVAGYWAVLLVTVAEQFGTNIRATATTTVPNLVRATIIPISGFLAFLKPHIGMIAACQVIVVCVIVISVASLFFIEESFGKDLNYIEE